MYVGIHESKCQNDCFELVDCYKYAVHPIFEVLFVAEHVVNIVAIGVKVPAISDWEISPFIGWFIKP